MPWFSATGKCVVRSCIPDWGKYGQVQSLGNIFASNSQEALTKAKSAFPGGWEILDITKQDHCHDGKCGCVQQEKV